MRRRIALLLAALPLILALGWAAAGVASAGGGCHGAPESEARPSEAEAATVKIDGCTFAPTVARVAPGTEVRFINASEALHDIVGRDRAWGTEALDVGREYSHRFVDEGLYPFSCSLHPGMAGVVVVDDAAPRADAAAAADGEMAQAVSTEPVTATASEGSVLPLVAIGAVSLLAGLAIGVAATRATARRDPSA